MERGIAKASCPSVRPSVCLSVTLRYCDHIRWISAKIISRLISLTISLSADPNNTPNFSRNSSEVGKIVNFRHLCRRISETVQDRVQVAIEYTRQRIPRLMHLLTYLRLWLGAYRIGDISETAEDKAKVTINGHYKVVYGFRLPTKCMTLNDLWARFKVMPQKWRNTA